MQQSILHVRLTLGLLGYKAAWCEGASAHGYPLYIDILSSLRLAFFLDCMPWTSPNSNSFPFCFLRVGDSLVCMYVMCQPHLHTDGRWHAFASLCHHGVPENNRGHAPSAGTEMDVETRSFFSF